METSTFTTNNPGTFFLWIFRGLKADGDRMFYYIEAFDMEHLKKHIDFAFITMRERCRILVADSYYYKIVIAGVVYEFNMEPKYYVRNNKWMKKVVVKRLQS